MCVSVCLFVCMSYWCCVVLCHSLSAFESYIFHYFSRTFKFCLLFHFSFQLFTPHFFPFHFYFFSFFTFFLDKCVQTQDTRNCYNSLCPAKDGDYLIFIDLRYVRTYVCICVCVCVDVWLYVWLSLCMYVCTDVRACLRHVSVDLLIDTISSIRIGCVVCWNFYYASVVIKILQLLLHYYFTLLGY